MSCWLKQSTAVDIAFGPFLDSADGNTVEGSLTITQPDIRLKKNGGAWAQKSAAQTLTHEENGWYEISLSTTDTDTLGILIVAVHESGALPVWREFLVLPANVYDSLLSTDLLQVDATQILGDGQSAADLKDFADAGYDPATNKVQGVVLTDTVTTYTGDTPQTGDSFARIGATGSGLTSLASQSSVNTIDDFLDTEITDIQSRLPAALDTGRIKAKVEAMGTGVIAAATMAADMSSYSAKIWIFDDDGGTADRYEVAWFKDNMWVTSGITLPKIQVIKSSDATNLVAETAMTEIGALHLFKKTESTNRIVSGASYWVIARATIDGSVREWPQPIGRDST